MPSSKLQHIWEYYQGAFQRSNERIVMLRSQNANLIVLTLAVFSLTLAMVLFFLENEGVGGMMAPLAAQSLFLGTSLLFSLDVFRPRDFLDLPISHEELELQSQMTEENLLRTSIANVHEALTRNESLYVELLRRHEIAFYVFSLGTLPMLAYMALRILGGI